MVSILFIEVFSLWRRARSFLVELVS